MANWLHQAVARRPDRGAIETPDGVLDYRELGWRATEAAASLAQGGANPVVLDERDPRAFALALHACVLARRPAIPIDGRLSPVEQEVRRARASVRRPDGVATIMHTSGTTSEPKPVELTYGNWQANALGSAVMLGLDLDERWLCPMPLAHVGGLSVLLRSTIYATTAVVHEGFDTETVLHELMDPRRRITLVSLVPTMLARLLDAGLQHPPTLRWALLGGGPIPPALLARAAAAAVPVAPTYGMTEACSQIATFGFALPGVALRVSEADGELSVRGPIVAPGSTDAEGWLRTGDLARFEDGRLVIVGRRSDTIVSGGENVAPAEVEAVLLTHPCVADAGVYGEPDPEWGEAVIAAVVPRMGTTAEEADLRAFCGERLARYKVPKRIVWRDELPRTPSGKLLRRMLPDAASQARR